MKHSHHVCPSCGEPERCQSPAQCVEAGSQDVPLYCPSCAIARGRGFPPILRSVPKEDKSP